ncbi:ROK family protein [Picrophilus oshimae]|uniref:Transcriptional repressor/ROK family n=1 Tax=Picrophilus torridus (strain ATCC 700027 / DSM 9790 / JCM 10055 / NBRC 100828 / KAW 2/3) TaxID=1122961 RepID=Q6L192_PICTO|nr:ROK family protein [Picrophilus oshimae]AAT43260.1 transcriptional repressor/ROK family [Picrophilus oshimae DSM 9789]
MYFIGFDIGGTNTSLVLGEYNDNIKIISVNKFRSYANSYKDEINAASDIIDSWILNYNIDRIGVSIGGPLDYKKGIILEPPHLPGFWHVNLKSILEKRFNVPVNIMHDALSSTIAEWRWGNGINSRNMTFMTFGTGFGAGFIINGRPYINDKSLEIGYNKLSIKSGLNYDYICSGSGLNDMAKIYGEKYAVRKSMEHLGYLLAFLANTFAFEIAVIGGVFTYRYNEFYPLLYKKFRKFSINDMKILPSRFGSDIGVYSSMAAALYED